MTFANFNFKIIMPRGAPRPVKHLTYFLYMQNIIPLSTNNTQITFQRQEDGYINATALCQNAGKQIGSYLRNQTTTDFLQALEADMQIRITELIQVQKGGEPHLQGTWVHPQVATHLAQWLSPKFAVQVSRWVQDWILKKQTPQLPQLPQNYIEALECLVRAEKDKLALENTVKEKELVIQEKDERLETARKVFKKVADNSGCRGFRECSIDLGIPQKDLRERLEKNKWICPKAKDKNGNKVLKPTVFGSQYDYVKYLPKKSVKLENGKVAKEFVITESGYNKLLQQLGKVEELKQMQK